MRAFIILSFFLLSACGFTPLYGTNKTSVHANQLSQISINTPSGRMGQQLNNSLSDRFFTNGVVPALKYTLTISLDEESTQFGFKQDQSTTRESYRLTATYTLSYIENGETLTTGSTVSRTAYDVVQSDFSNVQAKQDAQTRIIDETAQAITIKLATYFNTGQN